MEEEIEIFLEDCDDQLQMMEDALVEIQNSGANEQSIGAIFRAMHTIKGSAGMFGYAKIVTFAHAGENLLDAIREGHVSINEAMVTLFLTFKDHIEKLIALEVNEEEPSKQEQELSDSIIRQLEAFMPSEDFTEIATPSLSEISVVSKEQELWHLSLRFSQDFFTMGMSIHSIFNFLNTLGSISILEPVLYNVPPLETLNPLHAYLGFETRFESDATKEEIEEAFEFVIDDVGLILFTCKDFDAIINLIHSRDEEKLSSLLVEHDFFTQEDFVSLNAEKKVEKAIQEQKSPKTLPKTSTTLRVDSNKIDILINYMSEILIANAKVLTLTQKESSSELNEATHQMHNLLEHVRDGIMDIRMIQVGESFNKFKRIVNEASKVTAKEIEFLIIGGDTELDKTVIERISDPLVHMLRNSVDHGIETPQERIDKGKNPKGKVSLRTYADSGTIVIEIEDDGKGLDKEKILAKAIENGIVTKGVELSDAEICKLIFAAGLSTADKVSDLSGRGVGMDVVRRNIEDLRGSIDIDSTLNKGSKITIRLPLTLAIIDGFLVQVGQTKYIIPLESIQECRELTDKEIEEMNGNEFINLRAEMLPIMDVRAVLQESESLSSRKNIVIVYFGEKSIGLLVDELLGEHQTVIKSLGEVFSNVEGISGGSILGSGEIALIFDIARLVEFRSNRLLA